MKNIYVYKVSVAAEISSKAVNVISNAHRKLLTLITCNYTDSERIVVQAHYVKSMPFNYASVQVRDMLTQNVKK